MRALAFATPLVLAACQALEPVQPPPQEINVRVTGDPSQPLAGAAIQYNGKEVAKSGKDGVATLKLKGKDGDLYEFLVNCPDGFQSPNKPLQVLLKRLADTSKKPEFDVSCPPTTRTVVVAVRADNGPNLPVLYLNREIARTDGAGSAHVMFKMKADESFNLVLSTNDNDRLRPQNPSASFTVRDKDEVYSFDQKFVEEKKAVKGGGRRGPVKIGGK
jgi:hypothetical protein